MTVIELFHTACRDMALRALRREADLSRATASWLGLASGREFRAVLGAYLEAVQQESAGGEDRYRIATSLIPDIPPPAEPPSDADVDRSTVAPSHGGNYPPASGTPSAGGADQVSDVPSHTTAVPPLAEPSSDVGVDQSMFATSRASSVPPASEPPSAGGEDQDGRATSRQPFVPPLAEPDKDRAAMIEARTRSVRAQSGFYITERQGSRTPIEAILVAQIRRIRTGIGRRTTEGAVQYNVLALLEQRLPAYAPSGSTIADCYGPEEIAEAISAARQVALSALFSVPEAYREAATIAGLVK